jgi:hypothetical protein
VAGVLGVTVGGGGVGFGVKVELLELGLGDGLPGPVVQLAPVASVRAAATTAAASWVRVTADYLLHRLKGILLTPHSQVAASSMQID